MCVCVCLLLLRLMSTRSLGHLLASAAVDAIPFQIDFVFFAIFSFHHRHRPRSRPHRLVYGMLYR